MRPRSPQTAGQLFPQATSLLAEVANLAIGGGRGCFRNTEVPTVEGPSLLDSQRLSKEEREADLTVLCQQQHHCWPARCLIEVPGCCTFWWEKRKASTHDEGGWRRLLTVVSRKPCFLLLILRRHYLCRLSTPHIWRVVRRARRKKEIKLSEEKTLMACRKT